jgi:hypothetical protein
MSDAESRELRLADLPRQFTGARFGELVLHHYRRSNNQLIMKSLLGTKDLLPTAAQETVEGWIDQFASLSRTPEFWTRDCGEALSVICELADKRLSHIGIRATEEDVFNMFQIVVLNFAYTCHQEESSRMFIQRALGQGLLRRFFNWT